MPTYSELANNIRNTVSGGIASDDSNISDEQALFIFGNYRAMFIRRTYDKGGYIDPNIIQNICIDLQCADYAECCAIGFGDNKLLRSVHPIPKAINLTDKPLIISMTSLDGMNSYSYRTEAKMRWNYSRYTKNNIFCFPKNGYLWVVNADQSQKKLMMSLVGEDPIEISKFINACNGGPNCYIDEMEYPVSRSMLPIILQEMYSKEMNLIVSTPTDDVNDANNKTVQS